MKKPNVGNDVAREKGFASLDGGDDGEHNIIGVVKISEAFLKQNAFFFGTVI